jgi:cell division transport system ATP-binding protein
LPIIAFDQVSKVYPTHTALSEVTFDVDPGEFVLITGKSGAGKTSLAKLLIKEITPSSGTIMFEDKDLAKIKRNKLHLHRRKIGVIYQDYRLLPDLTVSENIALALRIVGKKAPEIEQRITDLLQLVQLTEKTNVFPSQLSGGEIQRVTIARSLANAPIVLFADEPTGNLDRETGQHIVQILKKINQLGTTVLMSTHEQFDFSDHPHQHLHLDKGTVVSAERKAAKTEKSKTEPKSKKSEKPSSKKGTED